MKVVTYLEDSEVGSNFATLEKSGYAVGEKKKEMKGRVSASWRDIRVLIFKHLMTH